MLPRAQAGWRCRGSLPGIVFQLTLARSLLVPALVIVLPLLVLHGHGHGEVPDLVYCLFVCPRLTGTIAVICDLPFAYVLSSSC